MKISSHIPENSTRGFALVIALSLMAFVLLLLMTLSALIQIETKSSDISLSQKNARSNALLGLNIALGQLQESMGPDRRVSAMAEIRSDTDPSLRFMTGVWDASNWSERTPLQNREFDKWLFSLRGADDPENTETLVDSPIPFLAEDPVLIGSATLGISQDVVETNELGVKAHRIQLSDTQGVPYGHYAFWVGDEGVKGRVNLGTTSMASGGDQTYLSIQQIQAPYRSNPETLDELGMVTGVEGAWHKAMSYDSMKFVVAAAGGDTSALNEAFYGLTPYSQAVLSDTRNGGLQSDLSAVFELDDEAFFEESDFGRAGFEEVQGTKDAQQFSLDLDSSLHPSETQRIYKILYRLNPPELENATDPTSTTGNFRNGGIFWGPSWAQFRDYYQLYKKVKNPLTSGSEIRAQHPQPMVTNPRERGISAWAGSGDLDGSFFNSVRIGSSYSRERGRNSKVSPVLLDTRVVVGFVSEPGGEGYIVDTGNTPTSADTATMGLRIGMQAIIVLWNPYDVALSFPAYSVQLEKLVPFRFQYRVKNGSKIQGSIASPLPKARLFNLMNLSSTEFAGTAGIIFSAISGNGGDVVLQPGEVKVFSIDSTMPQLAEMEEVPDGDAKAVQVDLTPGIRYDNAVFFGSVLTGVPGSEKNANNQFSYAEGSPNEFYHYLYVNENTELALNIMTSLVYPDEDDYNTDAPWSDSILSQLVLYGVLPRSFDERFHMTSTIDGSHADHVFAAHLRTTKRDDDFNDDLGLIGWYPEEAETNDNALFRVGDKFNSTRPTFFPLGELRVFVRSAGVDNPGTPESIIFGPNTPLATMATRIFYKDAVRPPNELMIPPFNTQFTPVYDGPYNYLQWDSSNNRAYWGASDQPATGVSEVVSHHIPRAPIWSLGTLQHAAVSSFPNEPSHVIGSSFAPTHITQDKLDSLERWYGDPNKASRVGDAAFLGNQAVWDSFFFSSITDQQTSAFAGNLRSLEAVIDDIPTEGVPNERYILYGDIAELKEDFLRNGELDVDAYKETAQHLLIEGSFNVNSTSELAWRVFLTGLRDESVSYSQAPVGGGIVNSSEDGTPFPRTPFPQGAEGMNWRGFARLSDAQIKDLAKGIVAQVKLRGPFMSMADFVNRRLVDDDTGLLGALQAALDASGVNSGVESLGVTVTAPTNSDYRNPDAAKRSTVTGISAYITQGDILQALGNYMRPRSDTFRIRSYGDYVNPFTGQLLGKAWCEAIVQRLPEYVDDTQEPTMTGDTLSIVNQNFGRRFVVKHFRWLTEDEI